MTHMCLLLRSCLAMDAKAMLIEWCVSIEAAMSIDTRTDPGVLFNLSVFRLSSTLTLRTEL